MTPQDAIDALRHSGDVADNTGYCEIGYINADGIYRIYRGDEVFAFQITLTPVED